MNSESNDRRPGDYLLFALAFLGFMVAATGVVVASRAAAVTGFFLLLFSLFCFWVAQPPEM
jgi:hypothetical protein